MARLFFKGEEIIFHERPGFPRESFNNGIFRTVRVFDLPWAKRWKFIAVVLGYPELKTDRHVTYISRNIPVGYITDGLNLHKGQHQPWLYPVSIESIEGIGRITGITGDVSQNNTYEIARITITYESTTYSVRSDQQMLDDNFYTNNYSQDTGQTVTYPDEAKIGRFVTKHYQPTAEYLTLPFGALHWCQTGDLAPITGSYGKVVTAVEMMYVWHQVPSLPTAINTHIGCVNDYTFPPFASSTFRPDVQLFPRGTLLLTSVDLRPYRWLANLRVWDITYKFKYFQPKLGLDTSKDRDNLEINEYFGHNHFLRHIPNAGLPYTYKYQMITHNAMAPQNTIRPAYDETLPASVITKGKPVYEYKNFAQLFEMTQPEAVD